MKRILCRLAQKRLEPSSWSANHVAHCNECQSYFDRVQSIEQDLRAEPGKVDQELCGAIMSQVQSVAQPAMMEPAARSPVRPWIFAASGLAATAALVLAVLALTEPEKPTQVESVPPEEPLQPTNLPVPNPQPAPELTLAYAMEQQVLLGRDAQKLGAHLREHLSLFQPVDQ